MPSIDLGLPAFATDWWWNFGFTEALRRVTIQQRGASTPDAFNYYSALITAMNAINSEAVPPVPPLGSPAARRYCYAIATPLRVRAAGVMT